MSVIPLSMYALRAWIGKRARRFVSGFAEGRALRNRAIAGIALHAIRSVVLSTRALAWHRTAVAPPRLMTVFELTPCPKVLTKAG